MHDNNLRVLREGIQTGAILASLLFQSLQTGDVTSQRVRAAQAEAGPSGIQEQDQGAGVHAAGSGIKGCSAFFKNLSQHQ